MATATCKPYFIGMGTSKIQDFDTLEEMFYYHKNMKDEDRHFCKLYDSVNKRMVDGWDIQYNYNNDSKWRKW